MNDSASPPVLPIAAADALPQHLEALRRQVGPDAWNERLGVARQREQTVRRAAELRAAGMSAVAAAEACGVPAKSLARWRARHARYGLIGLIDRGRLGAVQDGTARSTPRPTH